MRRQRAGATRASVRARLRAAAGSLLALLLLVAIANPRSVEAETLPNGYSYTFFVNDLRTLADTTPGDGVCATTSVPQISGVSSCTLRAAIQEANALADTNTVLVVPAAQMRTFAGAMVTSGLINLNLASESGSAPEMLTSSTSPTFSNAAQLVTTIDGDFSARYWMAQPGLTLDFQNRLGFTLPGDSGTDAIILATGSNQTVRNFTTLTSAEGGIYVGGSAVNFTLENGFLGNTHDGAASPANYSMERALVIVEGATNTTVRNITFERNYTYAVLLVPGSASGAQINGLTITRSSWGQPQNAGPYDPAYNFFLNNWNSLVSGRNIVISQNDIRDWSLDDGGTDVIALTSGTWSDVTISDNTFTNTSNSGVNAIQITSITASNFVIERNSFTNTVAQALDVGRSPVFVSNSAGVSVRDNQIVGGGQSVNITTDGGANLNPVVRNTMSDVGGTPTAQYENGASVFNNIWNLSNNQIRTTYPTAASIVTSPPASCQIDVTIAPPTTSGGNAISGTSVWVDVFIGPATGMGIDQHLGRFVTTTTALPATVRLPYTGAGTGSVVRVQTTEVSTGRTSAYSRTVAASGADACGPQLWLKQGGWAQNVSSTRATQNDPTTGREVVFDIRASEAPGTNGLATGDITFAGTAPGQEVVSLTQITPTSWRLVTRASGSGTIVPVIAAGAVNDAGGLASGASNTTGAPIDFAGFTDSAESVRVAGGSIDSSVTYQSPLELTVSTAAVTEGGASANLTIGYTASAMSGGIVRTVPQYDLVLTPTLSGFTADPSMPTPSPAQTAGGVLSASTVTMTSSVTSAALPVTAINNTVVDGTRTVSLAYTVSSTDPEFNGLQVRSGAGSLATVTISDNDAGAAAQSSLALTANNALADGVATNEVTATVRNAAGQLVANALVSLVLPAGVTHDPLVGASTVGPATIQLVTDAAGIARAPLTSITSGTAFAITASVASGALGGSPAFVTFTGLPATASQSQYGVSTGTVQANGLASHVVTIDLRSTTGQPVSGDAASLSVIATPSTGVTVGTVVETSTPGTYRALVSSTVATTITMEARLDGTPITTLAAGLGTTATFVAGAVDLVESTVELVTDGSAVTANGTETHLVRVLARDSNGNPVAGVSVLTSGSDDLVITDETSVTDAAGEALVEVTTTVAGGYPIAVTIGGSAPSGSPVTATFVAGAADPAVSQFSVSGGAVEANGLAQHWAQVVVTDSFGNPVSGQTITFAGDAGLVLSTPSAMSNSEGIARVDLTSMAAGTYAISAALATVEVGASTVTFAVGAPSAANSNWTVSPTTPAVANGVDAIMATVTVRDGSGNLVESAVVSFSAPVGVDVPTGPHVTNALGEVSVPLTSTSAGSFVVVAFLGGNQIGTPATVEYVAGPPSTWLSTISATPLIVEADGVDETVVSVRLVDAYSNPILVGGATVVVTTDRGSASTVIDNGDGTYRSTVSSATAGTAELGFTVAGVPGASTVNVEFIATPAAPVVEPSRGTVVAGSAAPGLLMTVTDAAGSILCSTTSDSSGAFECAPSPAPADGDSVRVTATDSYGFVSPVTAVTIDALAPASPIVAPTAGVQFVGAGEPFATITITSGISTVCVTTVSAGGTFTCAPPAVLADGEVVSATATDEAGNVSAPTIVTVDADVPSPPVVDPSSGSQIAGTAEAGSTVVVADSLGATLCSTTAAGDGTFSCIPVPAPSHGDDITIVATDVVGNASPPTVITIDAIAPDAPTVSPTNGTSVSATAEPGTTLTVRLGDGTVLCSTSVAPDGTGSCLPLPQPAHATTLVVTVTDAAGNVSPATTVVVDAVATTQSTVVVSVDGALADGVSTNEVLVTLRTVAGQVVPNADVSVAVPAGATYLPVVGAPVTGPATVVLVTDAVGVARVPLASTVPDVALAVGVSVTSGPLDTSPVSVTFTGLPAAVAHSQFGVSTGAVEANGLASHVVTIDLRSTTDLPVSGDAGSLTVTASPSSGVTVGSVVETSTPGTYRVVVSSTVAATVTLSARLDGTPITTVMAGLGSTATFVAGAVDLGQSTVELVTVGSSVVADGIQTHVVRVGARDANGNPISGVSVFTSGPDDLLITDATTLTDFAGEALVEVTTTVAGAYPISVTIGGSAPSGSPVSATFVAGLADAAVSQFTVSAGTVEADGVARHWAQVLVTDSFGNPVSGQTITFDGAPGLVLSGPSAVSNAAGVARIDLTSTTAGTFGISAALATVEVGASSVAFAVGAPSAAQSSWSVSPTTAVVANGTDAVMATVTVRDSLGNLVESAVVSFSAPVGVTIPAGPHVTNALGQVSVPLTSTNAGSFVVVALLGGNQIGAPATVEYLAGPPSTWLSTVSATPLVVEADGVDQTVVTVTLVDANANPILVGGAAVVVTSDLGAVSSVTDNGDGTYRATVSALSGGVATVSFSVAGVPAASAVSVEFVTTPASPVVAPSRGTLVSGSAAPGLMVTVTDDLGAILCSTSSDIAGAFVCAPSPVPANGDTVRVTASDVHGFTSPATVVTIDSVAPAAPLAAPSGGTVFVGTAEPFSVVTVTSGSTTQCTATVSAGGAFSCTPVSMLADGTVVTVVATDDAGNVSAPTLVTVDADVPNAPVVEASSGVEIAGSAEPGVTVVVTDESGATLCTATAASDGTFSCAPVPTPTHGDDVIVRATDNVGNESPPTMITIDALAPTAPTVAPTNGVSVTAMAEAGSTLVVRLLTGTVLCTTIVAPNGTATCAPVPRPAHGTTLVVTATDVAGNASSATTMIVDAVAPSAPSVAPTNGSAVVGTAEPLAVVRVSGAGPVALCLTTADSAGAFSCALSPAAPDSTVLSITAMDAASNTSAPATVTSRSALPASPTVEPTVGTGVAGTAIPGGTVAVSTVGGTVLCTTTALTPSGSFSCALTPTVPHATILRVTVTNAFGLTSSPAQVTVDSVAPSAPSLDVTDGSVLTGRAEPGSRVEVRDESGTLIGTSTAAGSGAFAVPLTVSQPVGAMISATSTDAAGNESGSTTLRVGTPWITMSSSELVPGQTQTIRGYDFQPGELTTLSIDGVGVDLAQQYADSEGRVQFTIAIPAGTPGGTRNVVISAALSGDTAAAFEAVPTTLALTGLPLSIALWVVLAAALLAAGLLALRLAGRTPSGRHRSEAR